MASTSCSVRYLSGGMTSSAITTHGSTGAARHAKRREQATQERLHGFAAPSGAAAVPHSNSPGDSTLPPARLGRGSHAIPNRICFRRPSVRSNNRDSDRTCRPRPRPSGCPIHKASGCRMVLPIYRARGNDAFRPEANGAGYPSVEESRWPMPFCPNRSRSSATLPRTRRYLNAGRFRRSYCLPQRSRGHRTPAPCT